MRGPKLRVVASPKLARCWNRPQRMARRMSLAICPDRRARQGRPPRNDHGRGARKAMTVVLQGDAAPKQWVPC